MSYTGGDFGFVGNAYDAPDPYQDSQRLINWYVEVSQDDKSKTPTALLGCPGLNPVLQTFVNGPVRGAWVLPGGLQCLFVVADSCYVATVTTPATQNSIAQFSVLGVGTLLTNNGQVVIRDNGVGGYAFIVDGQFGYVYRIAGPGTAIFTGNLSIGSNVITIPTGIPSNLLVTPDAILTDSAGAIVGSTITSINLSGSTVTITANASSNQTNDTFTLNLVRFMRITDPAFLGADRVAFIDGWLIFNQPGTQNFYTTAPTAYTIMFSGSFFAKNDTSSDNLVTLQENNRELWLVGERHSEVWYDAGGANFSFSRIPGVAPQMGCAAKQSIARLGDSLVWLGKSERGENIVVKTEQYNYLPISNRALEKAISSYPLVSDAFGYTYEDEGHLFYMLTFPTADVTWCYDHTSSEALGRPCWHQRLSYDTSTGSFHRHRSNCFVNFQDIRMVGDYQNGTVCQMSRTFYTDSGQPLIALRRAPHLWSKENRERMFHGSLQVEFAAGVGLQVGQGVDPQAMMRFSDDGGANYGTIRTCTIGKAGRTKNRAMWRRLGQARDRVYEVSISDPVKRDIVGATLYAEQTDAA